MYRFLVFGGWNYYPAGGMDDRVGASDTFEAAMEIARTHPGDWAHVYDTHEDEVTHI